MTPTLLLAGFSSPLGVSEAEAEGKVDDMEVLAMEEDSELVIEGATEDGVGEADDVTGGLDEEEDGLIEEDEGRTTELEDGKGDALEEAGTEEVAGTDGFAVDDAPGASVVVVHVLKSSQRNWA